MYACALLYVWVGCVLSWAHNTIKKTVFFFLMQPLSLAATKHNTAVQQQRYNGSAPSSRLVPIIAIYVRVAGAQKQEIEPQH